MLRISRDLPWLSITPPLTLGALLFLFVMALMTGLWRTDLALTLLPLGASGIGLGLLRHLNAGRADAAWVHGAGLRLRRGGLQVDIASARVVAVREMRRLGLVCLALELIDPVERVFFVRDARALASPGLAPWLARRLGQGGQGV
jgi:hypothetical protein